MSKQFDDYNDRDEIYGNKSGKKKKKEFREHGKNKVRDFKRDFSQDRDREDINYKNLYR